MSINTPPEVEIIDQALSEPQIVAPRAAVPSGARTALRSVLAGGLTVVAGLSLWATVNAVVNTDEPQQAAELPVTAITLPEELGEHTNDAVEIAGDGEWVVESAEISLEKDPEPVIVRTQTAASRSTVREVSSNPPPQSVAGNAVLEAAAELVGIPYVYASADPAVGFDCSGFVSYVYAQVGISLPRSSSAYQNLGTRIADEDIQPGDIHWHPGHVAIYAGDGMIIEANSPGTVVEFKPMRTDARWNSGYYIRIG